MSPVSGRLIVGELRPDHMAHYPRRQKTVSQLTRILLFRIPEFPGSNLALVTDYFKLESFVVFLICFKKMLRCDELFLHFASYSS